MLQQGRSQLFATVLVCTLSLAAFACVAEEAPGPTAEELDALDEWTETADGKADLPSAWNDLVAYVTDFYMNRMSAIWNNQEHPATASAAIARTQQRLRQLGVNDPNSRLYPTTVQRLRVEQFDHSEVNVVLAPGHVLRLLGDPKGAGAYFDGDLFRETIGPRLCLTWSELQRAIEASYRSGHYGIDYVCHTVTEKILRALGVGNRLYRNQLRTYTTSTWIWGPLLPNWNSNDPIDWTVSRACPR